MDSDRSDAILSSLARACSPAELACPCDSQLAKPATNAIRRPDLPRRLPCRGQSYAEGEEHAGNDAYITHFHAVICCKGPPASPPPALPAQRGKSRQGTRGRLYLCRGERRLWIQPGARRSRGNAEEDARREDRRGRKGPRDRRRLQNHGEHDRAGRRHPAVPHQLRLFRPVHAEDGRQIQEHPVPPLRRLVAERQAPDEHRIVFRLHRHVPVPEWHRRRPRHKDQEDRLHRRQADPAGADQRQQFRPRRPHRSIRPSPPR